MASGDLRKLWKLHLIDLGLVEVRKRAAALDPGRALQAEIKAVEQALQEDEFRKLHAEQIDLELQQKTLQDKLKKIDSELYGGKIVNPREIEAYQKEIALLKKQRDALDDRLLAIMELTPPLKAASESLVKKMDIKKAELADHQTRVRADKAQLEADFKTLTSQREPATQGLPPNLLAKYDAIRQKHDGIGMAQIDLRRGSCGGCGTLLPEKTIQGAKEDRVMTCESCHRILYYTEGLV